MNQEQQNKENKIKRKHKKIMSVILINYTYVDDVMRIWQGPEARPDREFIFPEEGHVNCFQVQGKQIGDLICSAILICLTQILGMDQPEESFN